MTTRSPRLPRDPRCPALARVLLALALALPPALAACDADPAGPLPDLPVSDLPADDVPVEEIRGGGGAYPENATEAQILALEAVNAFRTASGLAPVNEVESLNRCSQAHADFIVANCTNYTTSGLSPHEEDPSWEGFTGVQFWERMEAAGYTGIGNSWGMSEVIAFLNDPTRAVEGWVRTLYHRLPLLDPRTREIGYGGATISGDRPCNNRLFWNADVTDIGMAGEVPDTTVLYPPDGAKHVPSSFDGLESPTPLIPPNGWPSGTIITVQFARNRPVTVTGHRLLEYGTDDVPHMLVATRADEAAYVLRDPHLDDDRTLAMYAWHPLKNGTDYTVVIDGVRDGEPLHLEWTFKTNYVAN